MNDGELKSKSNIDQKIGTDNDKVYPVQSYDIRQFKPLTIGEKEVEIWDFRSQHEKELKVYYASIIDKLNDLNNAGYYSGYSFGSIMDAIKQTSVACAMAIKSIRR